MSTRKILADRLKGEFERHYKDFLAENGLDHNTDIRNLLLYFFAAGGICAIEIRGELNQQDNEVT